MMVASTVVRIVVAALIFGFAWTSAWAQASKDYAMMAKKSWSAFECAALASTARMKDEQARLFKMGYDLGRAFFEAAQAGKVEDKDISSIVPWGFSYNMAGPSTDFALGVIWSAALDNSLKGVTEEESGGKPIDNSLWKSLAETKFRRTNCELL